MRRTAVTCASCALAILAAGCSTKNDEIDRDAFFVDARIRQALDGTPGDHDGTFAEIAWTSVEGDTDGLEYEIGNAALGVGVDGQVGEDVWAGVVGGAAWQMTHYDSNPDLESEDMIGPWIAFQGGWMATSWLEAYARADFSLYFPEFSTTIGFQAGARFHVIDHAALFAGWRTVRYDINDIDDFVEFDTLELDCSGFVAGIELSF
jgi:hypothetical protein